MTGVFDLQPAPYKLKLSDMSKKAEVLDKTGKVVGRLSCPEPIYNVHSGNGAILLLTRKSASGSDAGIYRYKIGDAKPALVTGRADDIYKLTDDKKYMICREKPLNEPKNGPHYSGFSNPVKIILLDAASGFEPVFSTSEYSGRYTISPSGDKIVYIELAKDEYGDMGNFSLKVADIRKNKVQNIVMSRRIPGYMWCGNDALAVTTYDKFNIPTLNRYALDVGKLIPLVTDRNVAAIEPDKYNSSTREITYKTYPSNTRNPGDAEIWAIRLGGGKPYKPAPPKNAVPPGKMPGPGTTMPSGMPGMPPPPVK
ncbi:MAG: hypothetical protein ACYC27_09780 [Armatimonadota bacterium]